MTADELIALLDHAVELLEKSNKKLDKELKESYKRKSSLQRDKEEV